MLATSSSFLRRPFLLALLLLLPGASDRVQAATFTVTVASDVNDGTCDAHCSLREAILAANDSPGLDTIAFAILPTGVTHTIEISGAELPAVQSDLLIDGYTQPGSSANTNATGPLDTVLRVQLRNIGSVNVGLRVVGSRVTIRGLAISNFVGNIFVDEWRLTDLVIAGNFLGTLADGATAENNRYGVALAGGSGIIIGGSTPADRNLISGNRTSGINLARYPDSTPIGITVRGNLIGTNAALTAALPNLRGMWLELRNGASATDRITIGGAAAAEANIISGNGVGIEVSRFSGQFDLPGSVLEIAGNVIGADAAGTLAFPNTGHGITLDGALQATITGNTIVNNVGRGVVVRGPLTPQGTGVRITDNIIRDNADPGIDLGDDGRTANDADDSDTGANARLNFPVLTVAAIGPAGDAVRIDGTVQAAPNGVYLVELFDIGTASRPAGADAFNRQLTIPLTTDAAGRAIIRQLLPISGSIAGHRLVATLTDTTNHYTSEISDARIVIQAGPSISGTITQQAGVPLPFVQVTLEGTASRTTRANANGEYEFFDLPAGGNYTITAEAPGYTFNPSPRTFANLTADVTAGFTGLATSTPLTYTVNVTHDTGDGGCDEQECTLREAIVEANARPGLDRIHFAIPGAGPHLITLRAGLPYLQDELVIDGYTQPGATPNTNVSGGLNGELRIGLVPTNPGTVTYAAITVVGGRVTVRGLVFAGFVTGVDVANTTTGVVIEGNYFGTTPDGTGAVSHSKNGVFLRSTRGVTIGGVTPAARNLLSGHLEKAIQIFRTVDIGPAEIRIVGNLIGTDVTGLLALPNDTGIWRRAIVQGDTDTVRIGGDTEAERNVISGNGAAIDWDAAVWTENGGADQVIAGNYIGLGADGVTPLGNTRRAIEICGPATFTIRRNVIARNNSAAIALCTTPTLVGGRGVAVSENVIYSNSGLAIDLDVDGPTPNDADESDIGANNRQNYPVLASAVEQALGVVITGQLTSRPNRTYRVELFTTGGPSPLDFDARTFLAGILVTTDDAGRASFTQEVAGPFAVDEAFVSTATDVEARMTSELSARVALLQTAPRFGLSGTITLNGAPLPQVRVTLTGDVDDEQVTGADGTYAFAQLPQAGSYVITPEAAGYLFTPASAPFAGLTANGVAHFTAEATTFTRYLTEGAAGVFWETTIALLNPTNVATTATLAFLLPGGGQERVSLPMTGPGHVTFDPATVPALNGATFSTVVTATQPLVASRTMRWGTRGELGAHAEQALDEPRLTWYFAEGATGCFDLFYQLVNPGATPADVDITYVRRAPEAPLTRRYTVPAFARETVRVNTEDGLAFAEVSARIAVANGVPIVAERTMYASCYGTNWQGGHDAVASAAPAREWFFAEGATGTFFDYYLLLANFETETARVDVEYPLANGSTIRQPHTVPAGSRVTIDVAGEAPQLAAAAVSAVVRSMNGVPVVAERSQWWPHGGWYEGHVSAGATAAGVEWQLAGAEVGGAQGTQGYLLIANTGDEAGAAQVRAVFADGTTAELPQPVALAPHSRTTLTLSEVFPQAAGRSFGLIVSSLGAPAGPAVPAPIVVELSSYSATDDGRGAPRFWGAGTNVVGTRVR